MKFDMKVLHRRYARRCDMQESWCRDVLKSQQRREKRYY